MNGFEKVKGYETIKQELRQISDMLCHMDLYQKMGVEMPKGLLLYGEPGIGKSLMAKAFIEECNRKSYLIRRNKPNGDFVLEIQNVFKCAAENAPSIILLDDMDKFVVEERSREEYVALQTAIDEVREKDVYIIATANDIDDIPDSLLRAGRFDRKILVERPRGEESTKIIQHYLERKCVSKDVNIDDLSKMLEGKTCAEIETILNEAAMSAVYERKAELSMEHLVDTVLREEYGVTDSFQKVDKERLEEVAWHEAGHVVISEVLEPGGIGVASVKTCGRGERGGFVSRCFEWKKRENHILMCLGGRCAVEMKSGAVDLGAVSDLERAIRRIRRDITSCGSKGVGLLNCDFRYDDVSQDLRAKQEIAIQAEVEQYMTKCRQILSKNWILLEKVANKLLEKGTLLHSDIEKLKQ